MNRTVKWILWISVIAVVVFLVKITLFKEKIIEVRTCTVERGLVEEAITNTRAGTARVRMRASLSPQTGGRVVRVPFREGERVKKGDLLLKLDDSVQQAEFNLAKNDIPVAEAMAREACLAAKLASREFERGKSLVADGITTEQHLDILETEMERSRAACEAATAAISQAHARLAVAKSYLELTGLRAPFDGIIAEVSTEMGEWITPSPPGLPIPPVIDLLDHTSLYVSAPIDEMDSERVRVGLEAYISVDSRRGERFNGTVVRIAPYVLDQLEQNRTVEVEAEFEDASLTGTILPGTSADIEVILQRKENVLRIPTSSVTDENVVLVVEGERLAEREIQTGLKNWRFTEVVEGVVEGEKVVVVRDSTSVKAGALVSAVDDK